MLKELIKYSVIELLDKTSNDAKISKIIEKHEKKMHFVPVRYRVFGGLLQSLNIQFGNFLEVLMHKIVENEQEYKIIKGISGKKSVPLTLNANVDSLIDGFISDRQINNDDNLLEKFHELLNGIISGQKSTGQKRITVKHDIDCLFQDKNGKYFYLEIKYNDDHDTGKFVDINRKFIKTYAGLVMELGITSIYKLQPILYYFNQKIMKGNIYVPEKEYISRAADLFNNYFLTKYEDLDKYLKDISEDKEIIKIFDDLYKRIRYS